MGGNSESSVWYRILSDRIVAAGPSDRFSLENITTTPLPDGCLCWVNSGPGRGEWQLDRIAVDPPDGVTVIAPISGPGRWFKKWTSGPGTGGSGAPGAPNNSVQFNNGGLFGGSSQNLFALAAAGLGPRQTLRSSSNTDVATGWFIEDSLGNIAANLSFTDDPVPANQFVTLSGTGFVQIEAAIGILQLKSATDLQLTRGAVTWTWPAADGTAGQVLTTDGAGLLSWTSAGGGGVTLQQAYDNGNIILTSTAQGGAVTVTSDTIDLTQPFLVRRKDGLSTTDAVEVLVNGTGSKVGVRSFAGSTNNGYLIRNSSGVTRTNYYYDDAAARTRIASLDAMTISSDGGVEISTPTVGVGSAAPIQIIGGSAPAGTGADVVIGAGNGAIPGQVHVGIGPTDALLLTSATIASLAAGRLLSWDGSKNVYIDPPASVPTIQNINVAGPTNITNTMNTVALVNVAGASAVVLPAHAVGKIIRVKDTSNNASVNPITITAISGNIDGVATQFISTNRGSMTFISDGANWWIF